MARIKELQKAKQDEEDAENLEEPFYHFGFGLVSYRDTIFKMCVMFALFTLMSLPIKKIY